MPRETLDELRNEVSELRASRERLVIAADADRRTLERDLHAGVQQQLVALAVNLQRAGMLADADPAAAKTLLEEMQRDVQQALDSTTELAQRLYPPLLEAYGLASALRSSAVSAGIRISLDVAAEGSYPADVARAIYWCCRDAFQLAGGGTHATVAVREEEAAVVFEIVEAGSHSDPGLDAWRDRIEAMGGRLEIREEPERGLRIVGSLPVSR